jgi:exopolysaccharide biosynthesis polyprenyl glycosylphosphotransferase
MATDAEVVLNGRFADVMHVLAAAPADPVAVDALPRAISQAHARSALLSSRLGMVMGDCAVAVVALGLGALLRFGAAGIVPLTGARVALAAAAALTWVVLLALAGAYSEWAFRTGLFRWRGVLEAGLWAIAIAVVASYATEFDLSRSELGLTVPIAVVATLGVHLVGFLVVRSRVERGVLSRRCLVAGSQEDMHGLLDHLMRTSASGLRIVATCVDVPTNGGRLPGESHVVSCIAEVVAAAREARADTIIVAGSAPLPGSWIRRLSWALEGSGVELLVAPAAADLAGPRIKVHRVGDLPLLQIRDSGRGPWPMAAKAAFDRLGAAVVTVALLPVLIGIAGAVRMSGPGPVLFKQTRIGRHGKPFTLLKFRTMYDGADRDRELLDHLNEQHGLLFKIRRDPRITPVGRVMRRFSLDELPQLFNVLAGSMSLVGPRPPLPAEVERYDSDTRRRLLVMPGVTGLWQVSGRSDLSWEESMRLDLHYVDHWSFGLDVRLLLRTVSAVLRRRGAY